MLNITGTVTVLPGKADIQNKSWEGREYTSVKVACYVEMHDGTAGAFTVSIPKGEEAPKPGQYSLRPDSFYVKDGKLLFSPKFAGPSAGGATQPTAKAA